MREELERDSLKSQVQMLSNICNSMNCLYWKRVFYLKDKESVSFEEGQLLNDIRQVEGQLGSLLERMM
jgi:hypothetical protein